MESHPENPDFKPEPSPKTEEDEAEGRLRRRLRPDLSAEVRAGDEREISSEVAGESRAWIVLSRPLEGTGELTPSAF